MTEDSEKETEKRQWLPSINPIKGKKSLRERKKRKRERKREREKERKREREKERKREREKERKREREKERKREKRTGKKKGLVGVPVNRKNTTSSPTFMGEKVTTIWEEGEGEEKYNDIINHIYIYIHNINIYRYLHRNTSTKK